MQYILYWSTEDQQKFSSQGKRIYLHILQTKPVPQHCSLRIDSSPFPVSVNESQVTQSAARGTNPAVLAAFPRGHMNHFQSEKAVKASSASLPHPLLVKAQYWWISVIDYSPILSWWFCSGCSISVRARRSLCQVSCTDPTGTKTGEHQWHMPGSLHHQPHLLQHWDTAGQPKQALGTQKWQIPCSKLCWKLRILIPQLQNTFLFTKTEGFSWWSD